MKPWLRQYDSDVRPTLVPYPEKTLIDYLDQLAEGHPSNAALLFKGATMTYGELDALSTAFAAALAVLYLLNSLTATDREFMRGEVERLFGRGASIDDVGISLWGGIGFSAKEFRIADHPRFAANPLVQARELKLGVSFVQLLLGRVVVTSLTL